MTSRKPQAGETNRAQTQRFGRLVLWSRIEHVVDWSHPATAKLQPPEPPKRVLCAGKVVRDDLR